MSKRTEAKPAVETDLYHSVRSARAPESSGRDSGPALTRRRLAGTSSDWRTAIPLLRVDGGKFVKVGLTLEQLDKVIRSANPSRAGSAGGLL